MGIKKENQRVNTQGVMGYLQVIDGEASMHDELDGIYPTRWPACGQTYAVCKPLGNKITTLYFGGWFNFHLQDKVPDGYYIVRPFIGQKTEPRGRFDSR